MPWFDVIWTPEVIEHLAQHGVTADEFEEVVFSGPVRSNKTPPRFEVVGTTMEGRLLKCVFERVDPVTVLPVTAFDLTK